ncbi:MAG: DUF4062 domain-containing protein, partial [Oscillospiraceae bacterium]|nr:DUF4062 domain-containing protein [Oscillospiraceae bacterium]
VNGKVLPICLSEIDKCRPYFIGMIGNRYGSVLQTVPHSISGSIPWLVGKEGHSITELEMLYAVLEHKGQEDSNCAFYLRSDRLSEEIYSGLPGEKEASVTRLQRLKDRILRDERIPSSQYDSIEEFGTRVLQDLTQWLDTNFPETGDVSRIRREWYDGELLRNYIPNVEGNRFLDLYLNESNRPLMLYGDGARGKTAFLTAWQPKDGHKITVNCGADDAFSYWPSIAREIVNEIQGIDKNYGMPNINFGASFYFKLMDAVHREKAEPKRGAQKDLFFVTDEEREQFRTEFVKWMRDLKPHTPIVIVINDLNLLEDAQSKLLSWLPSTLPENLRIICSTNDNDMIKTVELLEWNVKEMPLFLQECAGKYITEYLHSYGKNLSVAQFESLLASGVCQYPGQLRFVLSFLINQGRFQNLDQLISRIAGVKEIRDLYFVAYDFLLEEYSTREKEAIRQVFALVYCSELSLNEQECFNLVQEMVSVNPIEWAHIYRIFEQFGIIKGDYWNIRNQETRRFAEQLLTEEERKLAHRILADHFTSLLHTDEENRRNLQAIRSKTMYAKAVLMHREKSNDWEALLAALQDREVLYFLSKLDWQWVCKGWMELFLHSDLDLPTVLMEMIREYAACEGEEKGIAMEFAALMVDLGYQSASSQVSMILGTDMVAGKRTLAFSRNMSPDFVEIYQKMQKLRREGQYRQLYAYVTEVLDKGVCSDLELCQILFFKTDIQSKLGLYHDAIQTANEYYRVAIKSGIFDEMFRALHMRGDGLFRLREFRDAREVMEKVTEISLSEGRLRDYLASRNVTAMCLYHTKDYDGAIAVFDQLFAYWEKLSDIREAATVYLNRGNALSLSGRNIEAMQTLKEYSEKLRGKPALESHYARFLGNIGVFALNLKEYAIAEEHLQEGIALCKKIGQEASLVLAYNTLFEVYKQSDRPLKAVEIGREQMELLWNRRGYAQIIEILKAVVELLLMGKYYAMAKSLEEEWKQRYSSIPGGAEYFEKQIGPGMVDAVKADAL